MLTIKETLEKIVTQALTKVSGVTDAKGQVIYATRPEFGDYQANGVMAVARQLRQNPRELAQKVIAEINAGDLLARTEVAGPGFINLFLDTEVLAKRASLCLQSPDKLVQTAERP